MKSAKFWLPLAMLVLLFGGVALLGPTVAEKIAYAVTAGQTAASRDQIAELSKKDAISPLFRVISKAMLPAVVEVRVSKKVTLRGGDVPDMDEFMRRFFGENGSGVPQRRRIPDREFLSRGLGSGVIVDAEKGYILTNYHVVAEADTVEVVLSDNRKMVAQWVRTDPQTDLAVVKIQAENLVAAPLGDSDKMEVGDLVLAFGAPESLSQTVTSGIISAKGRTTNEPGMYQNFLQTDAAINHGNSGGPLVNMQGEVIGINTAIVSRTGVNEGIGLTIPSNMIRTVMEQLVTSGKVTRGYLGVVIQNVDDKLAASFKLPSTHGALVSQVAPDSPAAKAQLKEGDFLTAVDGKAVASVNELRQNVAAVKPGSSVNLEFYRDGKKMSATVKLDSQPAEMASEGPATDHSVKKPHFGLTVETATDEATKKLGYKSSVKGALITEVAVGSDAAEQGLQPGMVITKVDGTAIKSAADFSKAASAKSAKDGLRLMVVTPAGNQRFVFLSPHKNP